MIVGSMAKLALKVDVNNCQGTRYGVPRLVDLLRRHEAGATFLFSLGRDHSRFPLLPAPDIGRRYREVLIATRDAGFETGIHAWDNVAWRKRIARADAAWTQAEMQQAIARHADIFGTTPQAFGAAGWQMNVHALRLTQRLGFAYASDCRGTHPFVPVWDAEIVLCPQIPTTLPTLDELIGRAGTTADNAHERLLALTAQARDHVFTLNAELEGMRLSNVFEKLLAGWREQGYELLALKDVAERLNVASLPRCEMVRGELPGSSGTLMLQGEEFLASWKEAA
jgi:peptidoglycan/xylan/chitin deacetylase (PgdA/CDA1 family)